MADESKFLGNWETFQLENWENFMKALEVGWIMRKAASRATSYINMSKEGDEITFKWKLAVKHGESKFKMEDEYDESTPDGRKVKSRMWVEGDKLMCIQKGEPADTHIERTIDEEGNMVEICKANSVECKRVYKKSDYVL